MVRVTHATYNIWKNKIPIHSQKEARCIGLIIFLFQNLQRNVHRKMRVFKIRFLVFTSNHVLVV